MVVKTWDDLDDGFCAADGGDSHDFLTWDLPLGRANVK